MISETLSEDSYLRLAQFWTHACSIIPPNELPPNMVGAFQDALATKQWKRVGELFRDQKIFGPNGFFVIAGPYRTIRQGKVECEPLGILGQVLPHVDYSHLASVAESWIGSRLDTVQTIRPIRVLAATDGITNEGREAFLVPDGWCFTHSAEGPALNDMSEQRRRFEVGAIPCLRSVFEPESADFLIQAVKSSLPEWELQHREFQYHEVGHSSGLGLKRKLAEGLLATPWYRGVEEWRADGIAFELLARTLSQLEAGKTIAANFALRFGIDAQRNGGMERDTDVSAALLTFESLFTSGNLRIGPSRKLEFIRPSYEGLLQSTEKMRYETLRITRDELALSFSQGLWGLYGSVQVTPGCRRLFQGLVIDPCMGIFKKLR